MNSAALDLLLNPRSIAIVGASPREDAIGFRVIQNLRRMKFSGTIYPVNPRYEEVAGLRCFPKLSALPERVDAAFLGVPAAQGPDLLDEAGQSGIRAVFVNAGGCWEPMLKQIRHMADAGCVHEAHLVQPLVIDDAEQVVPALIEHWAGTIDRDGEAGIIARL